VGSVAEIVAEPGGGWTDNYHRVEVDPGGRLGELVRVRLAENAEHALCGELLA
jgi:hypothetical protein